MPHPRIQELLNYLQRKHGGLLQAIDQVPQPLRDRRPALDRWSVADVMQHTWRYWKGGRQERWVIASRWRARSTARGTDRRNRRRTRCGLP